MTKDALRKEMLKIRKNTENKREKDAAILNTLTSQDFYKKARSVMTYISYNGEVDTLKIIEKMLDDKKTLCAPRCISDTEMEARRFESFLDLKPGAYGIKEPSGEILNNIDLILVPGVAFNENLHRIGYGKGYYDRFLKEHCAVLVGLFYESQKCDFKEDECDCPLDYIITEEKIYKRGI